MNTHSKLSRLSLFARARARALSLSKVPIAEMEGVQEKLANIGMITYQVVSAQAMFDAVLANGEKPPGTQFTCFPSTKVQILTEEAAASLVSHHEARVHREGPHRHK
jgi:hypothetical protein